MGFDPTQDPSMQAGASSSEGNLVSTAGTRPAASTCRSHAALRSQVHPALALQYELQANPIHTIGDDEGKGHSSIHRNTSRIGTTICYQMQSIVNIRKSSSAAGCE